MVFAGIFILFNVLNIPCALSAEPPTASNMSFTLAEGTTHEGEVSGSSPGEDQLHFKLTTEPTQGEVELEENGIFRYTADRQPHDGFVDVDSFTFTADDGTSLSAPATVSITITPVNDPPVAYDHSFTLNAGETYSAAVTATDIDGDTLTFGLVDAPLQGTTTLNADGSFTYTAHSNSDGDDSFTFMASDGLASSNIATVSIAITENDTTPPTGSVRFNDDNGEVYGDDIRTTASLRDDQSLVKDACLWLGDESENLLADIPCKKLDERESQSREDAPRFRFTWDSTTIPDGTYDLFVIATDNAGNEAKIQSSQPVIINNYSTGSPLKPKEITTCEEFQAINEKLGWHYVVMNDIDCSETKHWNNGNGFLPLGDSTSSFTGQVDGQNYHINNLYLSKYNSQIIRSNQGVIKNVNFRDVDLWCSGSYCTGLVYTNWGLIERVSITGTLTSTGSGHRSSAITHQNSGTINESWAGIVFDGGTGRGLVSQQSGSRNNKVEITNSYFRGTMSRGNSGLVGNHNENSHITNSYSVADFGEYGYTAVGGLVEFHHYYPSISISNSYWGEEFSEVTQMCGRNQSSSPNCNDEAGLATKQMQTKESFTNWDFENIWAIDPDKNDGYPYLRWQTSFASFDEPVIDTTPPIVTLIGSSQIELTVGDKYEELGATAVDEVDGELSVDISGTVDTSTVGQYKLIYSATDNAGNVGTATRIVTVVAAEVEPVSRGISISRMSNPTAPKGQVLGAQTPATATLEQQLRYTQLQLIKLLLQHIAQLQQSLR